MSFLQCLGWRARRTQSQYFTSISSTQTRPIVDRKTTQIIAKGRRLAARVDQQIGNSTNNSKDASRSSGEDEERSEILFNDSVEPSIRLTRLEERSNRYKKYLSKTPSNASKYAKFLSQLNYIRRQIYRIRREITES